MRTYLALIILTSIVLGGCSLASLTAKPESAATTASVPAASLAPSATPSPSPVPQLEQIPPTGSADDLKSLETDINATVILEESF